MASVDNEPRRTGNNSGIQGDRDDQAMTKTTTSPNAVPRPAAFAVAAATLTSATAAAAEAEDRFLDGLRSDDEDANYEAWSSAGDMDPSVIPAVSELLTSKKPNVRKAAEESLKNIVHSVGKAIDPRSLGANTGRPDDPGRMDRRQQVVMQLRSIVDGRRHLTEKTTAFRHLSLIATTDDVNAIAAHIRNPELREEAAFCLERIPGKASEEALLAALPSAADDFKPRILAALGHRRADEAVDACVDAMGAPDPAIAIAGMKAWGRIGTSSGSDMAFPDRDSLTEWQSIEFDDSMLRFADGQLEKGNSSEAASIYLETLEREEEHLQCAAIIGLAKIGTAEAAAAIFPKLDSDNNTVRITARQAWQRLAS